MRLNLTYVVVIVAGIGLSVLSSVKAAPVSNSSDAGDDCPTVIVKFHEHWGIDSSTPNAPREVKDELQELVTTYATFLGLEKEQHPIIQLKNTFKVRPEVGYKRGDPYQADFRGMGECQQDEVQGYIFKPSASVRP
ncbi:hypothetical protein C8J55DRAFT_39622 [Lentinula edodes]|uniref:Uncharacterized protein n=1 Tax=Lentinula lateritia TaxID=40482 RepID=A0A9W9AJG6_9AGAR|nr:hypothetical protein C8J55DRAFT_39622 [Lentinula edodes]